MGHRLLVVDDDAATRLGIKAYLAGHGFDVDCAAQADEAIAFLSRLPYAAVITDLQLSAHQREEGLGIVAEVRRRWPATRLVLFTGYLSAAVEAAARRLGADAWLHKAKTLDELEATVRSLVEHPP